MSNAIEQFRFPPTTVGRNNPSEKCLSRLLRLGEILPAVRSFPQTERGKPRTPENCLRALPYFATEGRQTSFVAEWRWRQSAAKSSPTRYREIYRENSTTPLAKLCRIASEIGALGPNPVSKTGTASLADQRICRAVGELEACGPIRVFPAEVTIAPSSPPTLVGSSQFPRIA
jgi:hypothetical protein